MSKNSDYPEVPLEGVEVQDWIENKFGNYEQTRLEFFHDALSKSPLSENETRGYVVEKGHSYAFLAHKKGAETLLVFFDSAIMTPMLDAKRYNLFANYRCIFMNPVNQLSPDEDGDYYDPKEDRFFKKTILQPAIQKDMNSCQIKALSALDLFFCDMDATLAYVNNTHNQTVVSLYDNRMIHVKKHWIDSDDFVYEADSSSQLNISQATVVYYPHEFLKMVDADNKMAEDRLKKAPNLLPPGRELPSSFPREGAKVCSVLEQVQISTDNRNCKKRMLA